MLRVIISTLIGGFLGFLYYKLVGCNTGTCPITSNPFSATIYCAIIGMLVGFIIKK